MFGPERDARFQRGRNGRGVEVLLELGEGVVALPLVSGREYQFQKL